MKNIEVIIPTLLKNMYIFNVLSSLKNIKSKKDNINVTVINNTNKQITNESRLINLIFKEILLGNNQGFSKAVNIGINATKEKLIFLINDDAMIYNTFEIRQIEDLFEKHEDIFSLSCKMISYDFPTLIDDAGDMYTILGWQFKRGNGLPKELYDKPCEIISSCGGAAIYNKKILDEIGYFDEDFFAYLEDVDLGLRALMRGYKNLYYPYISVLHVGSATTGGKYNDITIRLTARNSVYVIYKNLPLPLLIINFPFILLGYLIKFIFFAKKRKGKIYISGVLEGLKNLPKFKEKRKENMRKKKISNMKLEWILIKATCEYFHQYIKRILYNLRGAKK